MIAVLQRVSRAAVRVEDRICGEIGRGLVILLGVLATDQSSDGRFLAEKIAGFRIFSDADGKMNLSIRDVAGSALVISQFTLCGDWRKGRRPSFVKAADPAAGRELYEDFIRQLTAQAIPVSTGEFGAMMQVELVNDGPVTFVLDSASR